MLNFIWRRLQREEQGFTLVELLVVIAILGVLAGIGIPTYRGFIQRSYEAATLAELQAISMAVKFYFVENDDESEFKLNSLIQYLGSDLSIPDPEEEPNRGSFLSKYNLNLVREGESAYITADPTTDNRKPANIYLKSSDPYSRGDIEVLDERP